jgi:hypothetical protein
VFRWAQPLVDGTLVAVILRLIAMLVRAGLAARSPNDTLGLAFGLHFVDGFMRVRRHPRVAVRRLHWYTNALQEW